METFAFIGFLLLVGIVLGHMEHERERKRAERLRQERMDALLR